MLANFDQVVDNVRRLSRDLSPTILEDLGLTAALQVLVREFSKRYHIEYCAQETNIDDLFPLDAQVTIYRIFQESLTNIGKHSRATLLTVTISKTEDRVSFLIQDNGIGFKGQRRRRDTDRGLGLASMEERARMVGGVLSVWSQEGAGAKISFDIPFSPKDHRHQILRPSRNN
jgi:signal transduction histidine kinase